jgi:hypothetical protein
MPHDPIGWTAVARDVVVFATAATSASILWLRKRSSRHWPIIFGNVESASSFENNGTWLTDVSYSYSIQGDFYSGQFQVRSRSEDKASEHELCWKETKNHGSLFPTQSADLRCENRGPGGLARLTMAGRCQALMPVFIEVRGRSPALSKSCPSARCHKRPRRADDSRVDERGR